MGTYEDVTDAWLIALTRERRKETRARREGKIVRYSALDPDVVMIADPSPPKTTRKRSQYGAVVVRLRADPVRWRRRQWRSGNRTCGYCSCTMVDGGDVPPGHPQRATCDHRQPRSLGGRDVVDNFIMACFACNNRKGALTEAEFRALLESERVRDTFPVTEGGIHGQEIDGVARQELEATG